MQPVLVSGTSAWRSLVGSAFMALAACGGATARSNTPPAVDATPAQAAIPAPAPTPAEVSAQVRAARAACLAEATKQQLEVIDFVTFNRLDESNWDTTIRARRKGRLVRVGCRYDMRASLPFVYEPASTDGGNPWGPGAPPKPATTPAPPEPKPGSRPESRSEPKTVPVAKPIPGATIDLNAVADTSARSAIARTRDACLAEAQRRKISFEDFDAFRRVDAGQWEAQLLIKKGKPASRSCRFDLNSGKATIR